MNILVVGGGGREHVIIQKLSEDERVDKIYALPGNGGMIEAECVPVGATDIEGIVDFAKNHEIDFAVVAPDDPLALGAVDALEAIGIPSFGPNKDAAIIESSKAFSKDLMKKYNIPTAKYETFTDMDKALAYIEETGAPIVVKADGLALGKGVTVAQTVEEAKEAVRDLMENNKFGEAGSKVVIEEFLTGPEVSVLSFADGNTVIPMVSSMDHKRAKDNDEGPNTGGMGTIAPNPYYTEEIAEQSMREIFIPTIEAMKAEGRPFKGCLYFGLMVTEDGPKVIEYNCRFGDPEAQVVLPLLDGNLLDIMQASRNGNLETVDIAFKDGAAACVVMASDGYPLSYESGFLMDLPETEGDEYIFIAGAKKDDEGLKTAGGRVLGAVAVADELSEAIDKAYDLTGRIHFDNAFYRNDIGQRALDASKED